MISSEAQKCLNEAFHLATSLKHDLVMLEHLLLMVVKSEEVVKVLQEINVDVMQLEQQLSDFLNNQVNRNDAATQLSFAQWQSQQKTKGKKLDQNNAEDFKAKPSNALQRVINRCVYQVNSAEKSEVTCPLFIWSILHESDSHAAYFLAKQGIDRLDIMQILVQSDQQENSLGFEDEEAQDRDKTSQSQFLQNLNEKAMQGKIDPLIGREWELQRIMQILCRRNKNNPLLIGDPGVGKTALAEGLANKIISGEVPEKLMRHEILLLDLGAMVAGTRYRGDFEKRLKGVLKLVKAKKNCVLFIDEIHTIVGAGAAGGGSLDASNLLKPLLATGEVSFMGATTYDEFRNAFNQDKALMRRFQKVDIAEPSIEQTTQILRGLKPHLENFHHIKYRPAVMRKTAELANRYIRDRKAPDSALDILDEAGARWQTQQTQPKIEAQAQKPGIIDVKYIEELVSDMMRVPVSNLDGNEKRKLRRLHKNLKLQIYGQDEAIDTVVSAIKVSRAQLADADKPIGSFLFVGPTGVGKTELCRQVAKQLSIKLLRYDMSEYMEAHSISRLIGSPPGYVGHDKAGQLTEAVQQHPYSLVLLDEIEKAHPDIYALLLQVMDYGTLTDSSGKQVDFRNCILVMTSNVGAREAARNQLGFIAQNHQLDVTTELNRTFSPEFRNRLDNIVRFNSLAASVIIKIADKALFDLENKLTAQGIIINISQAAREWLAEQGYDERLGARPMQRLIQRQLYQPIASAIVDGAASKGSTIDIDIDKKADSTTESPITIRYSKAKQASQAKAQS